MPASQPPIFLKRPLSPSYPWIHIHDFTLDPSTISLSASEHFFRIRNAAALVREIESRGSSLELSSRFTVSDAIRIAYSEEKAETASPESPASDPADAATTPDVPTTDVGFVDLEAEYLQSPVTPVGEEYSDYYSPGASDSTSLTPIVEDVWEECELGSRRSKSE